MAKQKPDPKIMKMSADLLMKKSNLKKKMGDNILKSAQDQVKRTTLVSKMGPSFLGSKYSSEINDRLKNSGSFLQNAASNRNKLYEGAKKDSLQSVGLKSRADQAMNNANAAGRDTPLPSSEGMMSKIASGLASLFGK